MTSQSQLRPVQEKDFAQIADIHRYYVLNTVITFSTEPTPVSELVNKFHSIQNAGLPYIVATDTQDSILGYAYASGFRSGKAGYRHTVELSIFCHHESRGKGIGGMLLQKLLDSLQSPQDNLEFCGGNRRPPELQIRSVIACMAIDETARKGGLALKEFYERFGFEVKGHLHQVGHKFDRW